jgi:hypothetical protein
VVEVDDKQVVDPSEWQALEVEWVQAWEEVVQTSDYHKYLPSD